MSDIKFGDRVRVTEKYPGHFGLRPGRTGTVTEVNEWSYGIYVQVDGEPKGREGEYPFNPDELEVLD